MFKRNQDKYRTITIHPMVNGFTVAVGCQTILYKSLSAIAKDLKAYEKDPEGMEKKLLGDKPAVPTLAPEMQAELDRLYPGRVYPTTTVPGGSRSAAGMSMTLSQPGGSGGSMGSASTSPEAGYPEGRPALVGEGGGQ